MKKLSTTLLLTSTIFGSSLSLAGTPATYNNMFVAYYTPADVSAMVQYAKQNNLGGLIQWTINGDADYNDNANSLLKSVVNAYQPNSTNPPMIMSYWSDWSVYTADPNSHAIPEPAYPIPGSYDTQGNLTTNADLTDKLEGINVFTYSFVEAQSSTYTYTDSQGNQKTVNNPNPSQIGTLYFNDPWSDLLPNDSFCNSNKICSYATDMQGKPFSSSAKMGNFEAFAKLAHKNTSNPLGPLKKVFSVGGYGHDATFEASFDTQAHMQNFVNSAKKIIDNYKLDGIDLDYESPTMTADQSKQFLQLVQLLRQTLGSGKQITVTTLSDPAYLSGSRQGQYGFAPGILQQVAQVADKINLMTYDFHGAFDYTADGSGRTGFLTNLYMPTNAPAGYNAQFSVDTAVQAAFKQGVPANKVVIGFPSYGRALANIPSDNTPNNSGLFQNISSNAIIPRGDLDSATCDMSINLNGNSCSGSFQYNYIIKHMVGSGFSAQNWTQDAAGVSNGTTAYANSWTVKQATTDYDLEITNMGPSNGIGIVVDIGTKNGSTYTSMFGSSDWLAPNGGQKVYNSMTNPSTTNINGKKGLTVHWTTYQGGPSGYCPQTFDLTSNMQVIVSVTNTGAATCAISQLSQ